MSRRDVLGIEGLAGPDRLDVGFHQPLQVRPTGVADEQDRHAVRAPRWMVQVISPPAERSVPKAVHEDLLYVLGSASEG